MLLLLLSLTQGPALDSFSDNQWDFNLYCISNKYLFFSRDNVFLCITSCYTLQNPFMLDVSQATEERFVRNCLYRPHRLHQSQGGVTLIASRLHGSYQRTLGGQQVFSCLVVVVVFNL